MTHFGRLQMLALRSIAFFIDSFLLFVLVVGGLQALLLVMGLHPFATSAPKNITGNELHTWVLLTITLPAFLYFTLMFKTGQRATVGMRAVKIHITPRLGFLRAIARALFLLVPWEIIHLALFYPVPVYKDTEILRPGLVVWMIVSLCYCVVPLLNSSGKSIHDWLSGTMVSKARS